MSVAKKIKVGIPAILTVLEVKPLKPSIMKSKVLPQPPELAPEPQEPLMALVKLPNGGLVTGNVVETEYG